MSLDARAAVTGRTPRFDELFEEAVPRLLAGTHQRDVPPVEGGRWPVSVVLLPDDGLAGRLHALTLEAAAVAGPGHWHTGAADASHFTVRALEGYRSGVGCDDPLVQRCSRAMQRAAARCGPVTVEVTGLTLTPASVMATAETRDGWRFMEVLAQELGEDGWFEAGFVRNIWYLNLLHFTSDLPAPAALVDWVAARRVLDLGRTTCPTAYLVRFDHDAGGPFAAMRPAVLAQAALTGG